MSIEVWMKLMLNLHANASLIEVSKSKTYHDAKI
jgi:hypothetical protein